MDWMSTIGSMLGGGGGQMSKEQQALLQEIYNNVQNTPLPNLQNVSANQLGTPAMAGVYSDPAQRQQELETLSQLRDIYSKGGLDLQSRASLNEALNRASVTGNSARRALANNFAARGQLGSGAQLALSNQNAQNQANASNQNALDTAALGEQRKMNALNAYGQAASSLRGQDFSEASKRAQAQDEANAWNAAARERANYYNAGLAQQQFGNQMQRAQGGVAAGQGLGNFYGSEAQGQRNSMANLMSAGATGLHGAGTSSGGSGGNGSTYTSDPTNLYNLSNNPYPDDNAPGGTDWYDYPGGS